MADISKINPNGTEYDLKDAAARNAIQSSKTLKSSVVTVNDAAPINAEDITVDIEPIQDLHGYDRPWAGGAGKNKLPMTVAGIKAVNTSGTWSGDTYTKNGVSIIILSDTDDNVTGFLANGSTTASEAVSFDLCRTDAFPTDSYILNGCPAGGGGGTTAYYIKATSGSTNVYDTGEGKAINITSSSLIVSIFIGSANNKTFYPMLRLATETDSTFAPYSNDCPIEGWTGAELDRVGKNELPMTLDILKSLNTGGTWSGNIYSRYGTTFTVLTNSDNRVLGIQVAGTPTNEVSMILNYTGGNNVSYILSGCPSGGSSSSYRIDTFGTGVPNTPDYGSGATFTASGNSQYVRIIIKSGYAIQGSLIFYPMIRLASITDSTYEPYQGISRTVNFGETVYGSKWHVTAGGTDKTMAWVMFDGSDDEGWSKYNTGSASAYAMKTSTIPSTANNMVRPISNYAEGLIGTDTYGDYDCFVSVSNGSLFVAGLRTITEVADWKAYLAQHPLQVCYELATPTTISTPKQNVPMLKGINTVYADCGDTQLKYQPDNVVGELKGEIRAVEAELEEAEENLEIVYEDHVANTSMGIIVDGYSVGDMPFSNALDIAKPGYIPIAVTDTSIVHSTVATQGEIATHCLLDVTNNRVRFYVHVMDSAASLTIPPNSLTFRVAYKKA